jgi:hypothetical protein
LQIQIQAGQLDIQELFFTQQTAEIIGLRKSVLQLKTCGLLILLMKIQAGQQDGTVLSFIQQPAA